MTQKIDEGIIAATIDSVQAALSEVGDGTKDDFPPVFTNGKVLARPPFAYIHALAKFFARRKPSLGWTELLFDGCADHSEHPRLSKKQKLTFLSRILAVVSRVAGRRLDVLVSPSDILCGRDVSSTLDFLRALASSATASEEDAAEAVKLASEEGDDAPYRRGVRTRKAFTSLQAVVRGWRVRRRCPRRPKSARKIETAIDEDPGNSSEEPATEEPEAEEPEIKANNASKSSSMLENDKAGKASKTESKSKSKEDALLESYQAVLSRKSKVEDELKAAEARLNRENDKLIRILNLGTKHKTRTHAVPYAGMPRPPLSAPSIGRNVMVADNRSYQVDKEFGDKITNFSERQRSIKQKERRIDERECRLKQRFARSRQKEAELGHQEGRVSDLAAKMREQRAQLKERMSRFERMRLLEPVAPPEETSRPCPLCTEKKTKMRAVRKKIRQRARALDQREADVLGRAHELRWRETQLAKRERIVADPTGRRSAEDEFPLDRDDEPPPPEKHRHRRRDDSYEERRVAKTPPDVGDDPDPPRKKGATKRRRRSSTPNRQANAAENSMQASFEEGVTTIAEESIPTIMEETPAEEQEDSVVEEIFKEADASEVAANGANAPEERRRSSAALHENVVPTDIRRARQQLGISKERRSVGDPKQRRRTIGTAAEAGAERARRVSRPSSPKKRHVFTFERRESRRRDSLKSDDALSLHSESKSARMSGIGGDGGSLMAKSTPPRERGGKPRASHEKHDDWISSFDVQMKCAMNRLKELV